MAVNDEEKRRNRVGSIKRILIGTLAVGIIFPNVTCIAVLINQSKMQKEINALSEQLSLMQLQSMTQIGRIENTRLVDISGFDDIKIAESIRDISPNPGLGGEVLVADIDYLQSEDVVWSFSDSGIVDLSDTYGGEDSTLEESTAAHKVYLTFDDGPSTYTDDILDILAEYDVKATFFVVGKTTDEDLAMYKRIVDEGHTLGMHSYSHVYSSIYKSEEAFLKDYNSLRELLVQTTGVEPRFYRFPGGSSNAVSPLDMHVFIDCLSDLGITYFDWNIASGDAVAGGLSAQAIVNNSIYGIETRETSVILLHDAATKYTTVLALPSIIEAIQAMDDTEILPITESTELIQHLQ